MSSLVATFMTVFFISIMVAAILGCLYFLLQVMFLYTKYEGKEGVISLMFITIVSVISVAVWLLGGAPI